MIIAQLTDGLGNQMFQYAAAKRLAITHGTTLKLDRSHFAQDGARRYGLGDFNLRADDASPLDLARMCPKEALARVVERVRPRGLRTRLRRWVASPYHPRTEQYVPGVPLPPLLVGRVASERFYHYDPEMRGCPDDVCLCGFWQSERYFADVADVVRREFSLRGSLQGPNWEMARRIEQGNSVSVHVRRGDKATDPRHVATTGDYCQRAIRFFRERLPDPVFFVFSDDLPWVEANLARAADVVVVKHNGPGQECEDLRLMSLCRHHVVAPSTFSWWGAWLNPDPGKIVIHPGHQAWVRLDNHDTSTIFPPGWTSIDSVSPG